MICLRVVVRMQMCAPRSHRSCTRRVGLKEAEVEAAEAAIAKPQDARVIETLVSVLLARGRPDEAVPFIEKQRSRTPDDQGWIAYEATAARLMDRPLYRELYDYARFVLTL